MAEDGTNTNVYADRLRSASSQKMMDVTPPSEQTLNRECEEEEIRPRNRAENGSDRQLQQGQSILKQKMELQKRKLQMVEELNILLEYYTDPKEEADQAVIRGRIKKNNRKD